MNVRELNSLEELLCLEAVWSDLLSQTPEANFFQSLTWLKVYWQHYGTEQELRVLLVEDGGQALGILPLVRRREQTKVGPISYLTYPLDYWGSFYGPISPKPFDTLAAGVDYLRESSVEGEVLELRWVGDDQGQCEHSRQILEMAGYSPICSSLDSTAVITLPTSWDEYLASRTAKWRNNYRRWQRKLGELGEVSYQRFRPEPGSTELGWDFYDNCLEIAAASWQGASTTGTTLIHEEVATFLRELHAAAAGAGCADINLLLLDEKPIAFAYNYVYQGNVFGLRIGYDSSVPCKGIGNLLYTKTIEDSICRGDWRYDLGPRHLEIKRSLMTDELPVHRLSCYNSLSVRQQLMRLKRVWDNRQAQNSMTAPVDPVSVHPVGEVKVD